MMTATYDWTQFKKQTFIQADLQDVFQMWAVPEKIVQWFIAEAEYRCINGSLRPASEIVQVGDQYHWRWHQQLEASGQILDVVENALLRFTFGPKERGSDEQIIVTVTVTQLKDTVLLELAQENMADTPESHVGWHLSCNLGWSFFMTNMKALLEHGVDLREKDQDRAYASRAISL